MSESKTLIRVEESYILPSVVKYVDRFKEYNVKKEIWLFGFTINDPARVKIEPNLPYYKFYFNTERFRDLAFQDFMDKCIEHGINFD